MRSTRSRGNGLVALLLPALVGSVAVGLAAACRTPVGGDHDPPSALDAFAGTYALAGGPHLVVRATPGALEVELPGGDLLRHSDQRVDSRVLEVEQRTRELVRAALEGDRQRVAALLVPDPTPEYVDRFLAVAAEALGDLPPSSAVEVVATTYRDEDADRGFSDDGWGWQTFVRLGDSEHVGLRIVWDGPTGEHVHTGLGGEPPTASRLRFVPRPPARSWIRAFDPRTGTTPRVRDVPTGVRAALVPARFVAYDVATHQTVGLRFRRATPVEPLRIELGTPGGSNVVSGRRTGPP